MAYDNGVYVKPKYNVGDTVVCQYGVGKLLIVGDNYIVKQIDQIGMVWYTRVTDLQGQLIDRDPNDEVNQGWYSNRFLSYVENAATTLVTSTVAVNDHTCPSCGNTKCSKVENSCWKCGGKL